MVARIRTRIRAREIPISLGREDLDSLGVDESDAHVGQEQHRLLRPHAANPSRFESLILSHHFRFNVTCESNKQKLMMMTMSSSSSSMMPSSGPPEGTEP